jgi:tetratricopeptide (TPR) repeat protein
MTLYPVLSRHFIHHARTLLLCCLMSVCSLGWAQRELGTPGEEPDHNSVERLMRQARHAEALIDAERFLREHPRDPQMLFMRAKLLADLRRTDEALDQLTALIQQYPELPEPHNNLGVIQASRGHLDLAREAFEMALRNNPNYDVALENLGDVLLRQARQAYEQSLKLNPASRTLPRKLQALPSP